MVGLRQAAFDGHAPTPTCAGVGIHCGDRPLLPRADRAAWPVAHQRARRRPCAAVPRVGTGLTVRACVAPKGTAVILAHAERLGHIRLGAASRHGSRERRPSSRELGSQARPASPTEETVPAAGYGLDRHTIRRQVRRNAIDRASRRPRARGPAVTGQRGTRTRAAGHEAGWGGSRHTSRGAAGY